MTGGGPSGVYTGRRVVVSAAIISGAVESSGTAASIRNAVTIVTVESKTSPDANAAR
jgi:hypothetical protein